MSFDFMAFIGVLIVAPTALAIWIAVEHGKRSKRSAGSVGGVKS